jgi:hypothetical protein
MAPPEPREERRDDANSRPIGSPSVLTQPASWPTSSPSSD